MKNSSIQNTHSGSGACYSSEFGFCRQYSLPRHTVVPDSYRSVLGSVYHLRMSEYMRPMTSSPSKHRQLWRYKFYKP